MQCIRVNSLISKYCSKSQRHTGMLQGQPHNGEGQRLLKETASTVNRGSMQECSPLLPEICLSEQKPVQAEQASFLIFVILSKCPLNQRCSKIMRATTVYESNINRDIPCLPQELLTELFKLSYHHFTLSICKLEQLVSKWLTLLSAY